MGLLAMATLLQGEDGLWRASLNEPEWFSMPESSGSSFFTFGLAAGINPDGWIVIRICRQLRRGGMVCLAF